MNEPERFGPVAPGPCPNRTADPISQWSTTRAFERTLARVARGQRPCLLHIAAAFGPVAPA
jgi:hypothetical protein